MRAYGLEDPVQRRLASMEHLAGFGLTPDNPGYQNALDLLAQSAGGETANVAMARRTAQRTETIVALGGDTTKTCVYINDGPDPCPACLDLSGTTEPYPWFVANNAEPGDQCYGSSNCMCILQPIN
jgi:hypothetical protein